MKSDHEKREKFERIYEKYKNELYAVAMHCAKDPELAQELTQAAFYKLYLILDKVREDTVRALLIRMVKNMLLNHIRDTKREVDGILIDILDQEDELTLSLEEEYIEKEERVRKVHMCHSMLEHLDRVKPKWYIAVMKVYYEERSQLEVAEELGISIEVLHSRLYRARKWIREHYKEKYDEIKEWK